MNWLTGSLRPGNYMGRQGCYVYCLLIVCASVCLFCLSICCVFVLLLCKQLRCSYFLCSAVIMFIVDPDEWNVYCQRILEYRIKER